MGGHLGKSRHCICGVYNGLILSNAKGGSHVGHASTVRLPKRVPRIPDYTNMCELGEPEWQGLYPGATEEVDKKRNPNPRGMEVVVSAFVDANHTRDEATRRSVTASEKVNI